MICSCVWKISDTLYISHDKFINKISNFEMCNITLRQNIMECHPGQILSNKYKWFDFKSKSVDSEIQII